MAKGKQPARLVHPHAPEPLPTLASLDELLDLLGRAQMLSLLEPRSSNGRNDHPAHQLIRRLEQTRRELPLADDRRAILHDDLRPPFDKLAKAGYFVFARIITHRQPTASAGPSQAVDNDASTGSIKGIVGVLTLAAAHPAQKDDGQVQWT